MSPKTKLILFGGALCLLALSLAYFLNEKNQSESAAGRFKRAAPVQAGPGIGSVMEGLKH